jgi:hypothetical protein
MPRKLSMFDERGMNSSEDRPRRLSILRPLRRNSEVRAKSFCYLDVQVHRQGEMCMWRAAVASSTGRFA